MIEPNAPELDSNMIAVRYDGSNWVKADSSTNNWYNYDKGEWVLIFKLFNIKT